MSQHGNTGKRNAAKGDKALTKNFGVRMRADDYDRLQRHAADLSMSESDLIRLCVKRLDDIVEILQA